MACTIFKAHNSLVRLERQLLNNAVKWNAVVYTNTNNNINNNNNRRLLTTCQQHMDNKNEQNELSQNVQDGTKHALTTAQKVKEAGKTATYGSFILMGVAFTGGLVWYVANELLFGFSSNAVFSRALDIVKDHDLVQMEIGDSMKGFGEESGRGRRKNVSYAEYTHDGVNYMRVQFYVKGAKGKGTVHTEAVETSRGKFDFRYIFVELDKFPPVQPIIVLDNR